jgi:hypothetical protein
MRIQNLETSSISFRGNLTKYADSCGWVLCVGAGISDGVFPCWSDLAKQLFGSTGVRCTDVELNKFLSSFGAEALLQAAANLLQKAKRDKIHHDLSKALYQNLKAKAGKKWNIIAKALTSSKPFNLSESEWKIFDDFIATFDKASAPQISSAIAKVIDDTRRPEAILSFNAEPLLYSLINCHYGFLNPKSLVQSDVKVLKRLSHDLASRQRGQIPYYYVHGVLPVPEGRSQFNEKIGTDKLVFAESQYLQLSRSAYSWQSATFLASCIHHRCVFIGLSFSDPNLRRWLAWGHEGKTIQRQQQNLSTDRFTHFWLKKRPHPKRATLSTEQILVEKSVEHLGVKVVWLDDWSKAGEMLDLMLQPGT